MFAFKQFTIHQDRTAMKVGTDGVLLGAWAKGGDRILDIGTGTGLVALMMAQRFPEATVTAVELDPDAARQAADNAANSPFAHRVQVIEGDIRLFSEKLGIRSEELEIRNEEERSSLLTPHSSLNYDAIVANPPYYEHSLPSRSAPRDMARSAETLSFAELMTAAARLLAPGGTFSMVAPEQARAQLEAEAALRGLYIYVRARVKTVSRKPPKRVLLAFTNTQPPTLQDETVVLQAADGSRSPWYAQLTRDFYL